MAALRISAIARSSERAIVATAARRGPRALLAVAAMKLSKSAHESLGAAAAALRRSLFRRYAYYLRGGPAATALRSATVAAHDVASAASEALRCLSVAAQNWLIRRGHYYREQVFSEDLLHTIAKELASAYAGERLTIRAIQEKLGIESYRQARKIWSAFKDASAPPPRRLTYRA